MKPKTQPIGGTIGQTKQILRDMYLCIAVTKSDTGEYIAISDVPIIIAPEQILRIEKQ